MYSRLSNAYTEDTSAVSLKLSFCMTELSPLPPPFSLYYKENKLELTSDMAAHSGFVLNGLELDKGAIQFNTGSKPCRFSLELPQKQNADSRVQRYCT